MTPLVSVLMPVRDAARTLPVALRSVLRSRGVGFEVVCVNHRSTDASPAILARFARADPRVHVIDAADAPDVAAALEIGRGHVRGALLARMDADDVMHPERLAADAAWLDARPLLAAVSCRTKLIPRGRTTAGLRAYVAWQNAALTAEDHAREIWIEQPLCQPATTLRADVVATAGGWRSGPFPEDYELFLRLVATGHALEKRSAVHHAWRQHATTTARFDRDALAEIKARALVDRFALAARAVVIAGSGKEGRRISRALVKIGVHATAFIDVAPARIGRLCHGAPVWAAAELARVRALPDVFVLAAVGTSGARGVVRAQLAGAGFGEGVDFVAVA